MSKKRREKRRRMRKKKGRKERKENEYIRKGKEEKRRERARRDSITRLLRAIGALDNDKGDREGRLMVLRVIFRLHLVTGVTSLS